MGMRTVGILLVFGASCVGPPDSDPAAAHRALGAQLDSIEALFVPGPPIGQVLRQYVDRFADEAVLHPPAGPSVTGRAAILEYYVDAFRGFQPLSLEYGAPEIIVDGDLAVRRYEGRGVGIVEASGDTVSIMNRYIDVLRRSGREWRVLWHTWSAGG